MTLFCATSNTLAEESTARAAPALYVSPADLLASINGNAATNLTKGVRVARAGDDRVSIDVLKRTGPEEGPVIHATVTEIYQILSGGGTLETGGVLVAGKPMRNADGTPTNPESIGPSVRGTNITDGESRKVKEGDVVLIPPGTPHRFTALDGQVTYMVIRYNPGWFAQSNAKP
ncbi:MAG: AraC family ligand binding domain-containing protein [Steroidobacteraceae bacterium]